VKVQSISFIKRHRAHVLHHESLSHALCQRRILHKKDEGYAGSLSLSGSGEPGANIELCSGEVKLGDTSVAADGNWSWDGSLDPGNYEIVARTLGASGELVNESEALALTIEAPVTIAISILDEPQVDEQGTVTLSGIGEPGLTIDVLEDGDVMGSTVVEADGSWSFVYAGIEGSHELAVQNQAEPDTVSASVDIEVPAVTSEASGAAGSDEPGLDQAYIVQPGDALGALAEQFYGDWNLWPLIFEATNARAAEDESFHSISDPDLIPPGWKLWIPAQ
jgi:hypothetical protein